MPSIFRILGQMIFRGDATGSGNAMTVSDSSGTARVTVANQGRVTLGVDDSVTTETCAVIQAGTTNANLVIAPNGTGALIADIPDGTAAGGNARGDNAVDLQTSRTSATRIASGEGSSLIGGQNNTASATRSSVVGGNFSVASGGASAIVGGGNHTASGLYSGIIGGQNNTASGTSSIILCGENNTASADSAVTIGGRQGTAYLYCQRASASGQFAAASDAQTSALTFRRSITGQSITELFLNGASIQAILALPTGATNARAWRAQIDVVAICVTAGGGGLVQDECFMGTYLVGIKRVGANTSLVGAVNTVNEVSDTNMATAVTTITADDTNEALKIEFTPPTTADGTTVIRVVATAYLTEVGR